MKLTHIACLSLALAGSVAFAQPTVVPPAQSSNTTVLPLWNTSGQVDGLLLIEPSTLPGLPSQRVIQPGRAAGNGLGLRAGLTISTSIPIAVMTVAAFKLVRRTPRA